MRLRHVATVCTQVVVVVVVARAYVAFATVPAAADVRGDRESRIELHSLSLSAAARSLLAPGMSLVHSLVVKNERDPERESRQGPPFGCGRVNQPTTIDANARFFDGTQPPMGLARTRPQLRTTSAIAKARLCQVPSRRREGGRGE